jgi:hypothetical protein
VGDRRTELVIGQPSTDNGRIHWAARLTSPAAGERTLWFSTGEEQREAISAWGDPFVLAALLPAMAGGTDLDVRGAPVSGSLLMNLRDFQEAWRAWRGYRVAGIRAEEERERPGRQGGALVAFSGGVDAAYTVLRHCRSEPGTAVRPIAAAVMAHGFDIPLEYVEGFERARGKAERLLDSVGLSVMAVDTNLRASLKALGLPWNDTHGLCVAAVLTLFAGGFGEGLIASSGPYDPLILPWGSNPVTDPMTGSDTFAVIHDGAGATRRDKIEALSKWPEALVNVRFCFRAEGNNCGRCGKCINTALLLDALGISHQLFEDPPTEQDIIASLRRRTTDPVGVHYRRLALEAAYERGVHARWVRPLRGTVMRERCRAALGVVGRGAYRNLAPRVRRFRGGAGPRP